MKSFINFFTAIALTLIPSVYANTASANEAAEATGRANTAIEETYSQAAPSAPEVVQNGRTIVTSDFGGSVGEYIMKYNKWRLEGRKVQVNDDCMSACTFLIGRLKPENVCVTDIAQFAFHSAWQMTFAGPQYSEEATKLMWAYYPEPLKVKLRELGWDGGEHPGFVYIKGTDLFPLCD